MEYGVRVGAPCSVRHESSRVSLSQRLNSRPSECTYHTTDLQCQRSFHLDPRRFERGSPECMEDLEPPGLRSDRASLAAVGNRRLASVSPYVTDESTTPALHESQLEPQPLRLSSRCRSRLDDLHWCLPDEDSTDMDAGAQPWSSTSCPSTFLLTDGNSFALSALFSSDPAWMEAGSSSDEWKMFLPFMKNADSSFLQPQSVPPAFGMVDNAGVTPSIAPSTMADSRPDWRSATVRSLFLSLTGEAGNESMRTAPLSRSASPCSRRNTVELLMAQLTDDSDGTVSRTPNPPLPVMSKQPEALTLPVDLLTAFGMTLDSVTVALSNATGIDDGDVKSGSYAGVPCSFRQSLCRAPPFAVGFSPLASPRGRLSEKESKCYPNPIAPGHNSSTGDSPRTARSDGRRLGRPCHPSLNAPSVPVVDRTTLSNVHRNTPQACRVKDMITKSSHSALLVADVWPPRTKHDVVVLLKRMRAKELLRHLRIISFSRKDPQGVCKLFESWSSKGIPPPDIVFGTYYRYAVKKLDKEMCLKHNGRGRVTGHGWGCDYASKGPLFKCRFHHACLFCEAEDHGWFDEDHCERYLMLQNEMIRLGVTDAVAIALLDALECDERATLRDNVA